MNRKKTYNIYSFEEAKKLLKDFFDFEKEKNDALKLYKKWGLTEQLIKVKLIRNEEDFEKQFEKIKFVRFELDNLLKRVKSGEKFTMLFIPPLHYKKFHIGNLFDVLFKSINFNLWEAKFYQKILKSPLAEIRSFNLSLLGDLTFFSKLDLVEQNKKLKDIYLKIKTIKTYPPQIFFCVDNFIGDRIFYPDLNVLKKTNLTIGEAIDISESVIKPTRKIINLILTKDLKEKVRYIDPVADFILKRKQFDSKRGKIPQSVQSVRTIYLNSILRSGELICSYWEKDLEDKIILNLDRSDWNLINLDFEKFATRTILGSNSIV